MDRGVFPYKLRVFGGEEWHATLILMLPTVRLPYPPRNAAVSQHPAIQNLRCCSKASDDG